MQRQEIIELIPYEHLEPGKLHLRSKNGRYSFSINHAERHNIVEMDNGVIIPDINPRYGTVKWFYHRDMSRHEVVICYLKTSNKRTWRQECNKLRLRRTYDRHQL